MRTTISPYIEPEKQFIAQELAHFYDLPMFAFGGCSESKLVDQQAGIEAALTLMTNTLAGSHLVLYTGKLLSQDSDLPRATAVAIGGGLF